MAKGEKTKKVETTNQVTNQTSTPNTPDWLSSALQGQLGAINAFGATNPQSLVAPASSLQNMAFSQAASRLGGGASGKTQPSGGASPVPASNLVTDKNLLPQVNGGGGDGYAPPQQSTFVAPTLNPGEDPFSPEYQARVYQASVASQNPVPQPMTPFEGSAAVGTPEWEKNFSDAATAARNVGSAGPNLAQTYTLGGSPQAYAQQAGAASLLDGGLARYLSPYQSQVTDAAMADFDANAGRVRAQQSAQGALNGAFGGSRYGIQEAQTEGELARARNSGLASILQGGFDRATSLADSDANRSQSVNNLNAQLGTSVGVGNADRSMQGLLANLGYLNQGSQFNAGQQDQALARSLQSAGLLGDLGSSLAGNQRADRDSLNNTRLAYSANDRANRESFDNTRIAYSANDRANRDSAANITAQQGSTDRSNIGLLAQLGEMQRGIDANQRTAGLSQLQALSQLYGQFPSQLFTGQTVNGTSSGTSVARQDTTPGILQQIGQGAQTAASLAALFSDERLKENIVRLGTLNGQPVYSYNYVWSDKPEVGVIAQETPTYAVSRGPGGFLMVDYGAL